MGCCPRCVYRGTKGYGPFEIALLETMPSKTAVLEVVQLSFFYGGNRKLSWIRSWPSASLRVVVPCGRSRPSIFGNRYRPTPLLETRQLIRYSLYRGVVCRITTTASEWSQELKEQLLDGNRRRGEIHDIWVSIQEDCECQ